MPIKINLYKITKENQEQWNKEIRQRKPEAKENYNSGLS